MKEQLAILLSDLAICMLCGEVAYTYGLFPLVPALICWFGMNLESIIYHYTHDRHA